MGDSLLSDLCSIWCVETCNTAQPKYRCPGCSTRTCSLACFKRHKQRAQCSGKRDPTKYVKKSQLATPAGIDHDYNFLTGIERGLDKAERHVDDSGLGAAPSDLQTEARKRVDPRKYEAAGVHVIRAPKGMSRQKENKTFRNTNNNINWTVEWIHPDTTRSLSGTSEKTRLEEVYCGHVGQAFPKPAKKRKRTVEESTPIKQEQPIKQETQDASPIHVVEARGAGVTADSQEAKLSSFRGQSSSATEAVSDEPTSVTGASKTGTETSNSHYCSPSVDGPSTESVSSRYTFFLLRPRTTSDHQVLIPLFPNATLADCLRGRTVLEFPTIYVFGGSCVELPENFMLEEDYLKQESEDQKDFEELMMEVNPKVLQGIKSEDTKDQEHEEVDSKRILDVLKQDLGAAL